MEKILPYIADSERNEVLLKTRADLLMRIAKYNYALELYEKILINGKADDLVKLNMKKAYMILNSNDSIGFDTYLSKNILIQNKSLKDHLSRSTLRENAPQFTLTDIDSNVVSLSNYIGKVVILDFWATWCGPCKASFPAMQMAIDKYRGDSSVVFLFIHTWESVIDPIADVKNFLADKKYTFHVLLDLKDKDSNVNKVVKSYNVDGIPAKFVIDTTGKIRFKLKGFSGSNEASVNELSMMIDLSKS